MEDRRNIAGKNVGHFEILGRIGAGGMGEVFRARDRRLNREVALKVLPQSFASDQQRMGRFEREAQLLASLNHPNIAQIYGLEEIPDDGSLMSDRLTTPTTNSGELPQGANSFKALVMELVEGEDLSEWIAKGPILETEAIEFARQIADGLEDAHEKGIIHRDLKPANIKISADGRVKILDFGLAKALDEPLPSTAQNLAESPTLSIAATQAGVILGTAGYMSPEQAKGKPVDRRADIWAFGIILFEMLSGRRVFKGEGLTETLAAVMRDEPDWEWLPPNLSPRLIRLLKRCLAKEPRQRLRDIGDARLELSELPENLEAAAAESVIERRTYLPWVATAVCAMLAGLLWIDQGDPVTAPSFSARVNINLPDDKPIALEAHPSFALSPDAASVAFISGEGDQTQLYVRELGQFEARLIPGTKGAVSPFFSPDGLWIGFFADSKLKKVPIRGGTPITLATAGLGAGGSWGEDDTIIFSQERSQGLMRIPAAGGKVEAATALDHEASDSVHIWPQLIPGGNVLFTVLSTNLELLRLAVQRPGETSHQVLIEEASWGWYIAAEVTADSVGRLAFVRKGSLYAVPFDLEALELRGEPVPVLEGVKTPMDGGLSFLSISASGSLLYVPGSASADQFSLVWVDREGNVEPISSQIRGFEDLHLSPDGNRIAMTIEEETAHVWVYDIQRDAWTNLVPVGESRDPIWSPDGRYVTYGGKRDGTFGLFRRPYDGSGPEETVLINSRPEWLDPISWSADGHVVFYDYTDPDSLDNIGMVEVGGKPQPFLETPEEEWSPRVSPDGKWIAYNSTESGSSEVYVRSYPDNGSRWQVSTQGGWNAIWSKDGRELFYRRGDTVMRVPIQTDPTFIPGKPEPLFKGRYRRTGRDYDISPNGSRFVMMEPQSSNLTRQLNLILGWSYHITPTTSQP